MPNDAWNMGVDVVPTTTGTYNLGTSQKKWVVNGYTLGDACGKAVDTSISSGSTSTNVPTTKAVSDFVGGNITVSGTKLIIS